MPVTHPVAGRRRRPPLPDLVVPVAGTLLVLAGAAGLVPALAAAALAVAAGCTLACVRLAWLAGAPPARAEPDRLLPVESAPAVQPRATPPPTRGGGSRRTDRWTRQGVLFRQCAAILDAAVLAAGLTVAVLPLTDPPHRTPVALVGLAVTAPLYAVALLRLPGRLRRTAAERLRRAVDVLGLGLGLVFAVWMLLPPGPVPAVAIASVAGASGVAVLLVTARADRCRRPGVARCSAGAAASLAGLTLLVVLLAHGAPDRAALAVVPPLLAGVLLTADGARRAATGGPSRPDGIPAVWPWLTAPAGIAALAAGHRLWTAREIAVPAIALGLAVIPPMVLREVLAVVDQRRRADRLARESRLRTADDRPGAADPVDDRPDTSNPLVGWPDTPDPLVGWLGASDPLVGPPGTADPLAGLADRNDLVRGLARREGGALLVVDLVGAADGAAVDRSVLVEVARRLRAGCGPGDLVARLADAEFAVLTDVGPVVAYALGSRLLAGLTEPGAGGVPRIRVSVGLAETTGGDPEDVLRQADLARRRAVQLGRDRVEWYDAYLEEQLVRRLDLERELPGALARGELDLVYQPVVALIDRQPVGTEALLRWRSPALGTVLPDELLPVATDLDLLGEVGRWVLDRACRQLADWSGGGRKLWMAVNVTPRELAAPDFVARAAAALAAYDVPPERLVVEVAEPAVGAELSTVVARLAGLRSLGVRTALDDFRAEHASLAQLRRLPIDLLKVGPHLVGPAADGRLPLIEVVAALGDRLGLEVVVEGLESDAQVAGARRAGCRYGQGFAVARPATAERVEAWFEELGPAHR
ncbi:putative bifunctional diguanylate cyclase/phosphodiesterase [Micromonospora sp. SL1-18]|uniref:putative bifunctional diguanylate cyclase/phosphodiesterase n=1 Tax=Micromonospora sp. SL1-18 TaxID=3399128 RepID=UPI003A4DD510